MIQIRAKNDRIVFRCNEKELAFNDVQEVKNIVEKKKEIKAVVNLEGVSSVKSATLSLLKKISEQNKLSLCSLEADIFATLNLLEYDKSFHIFPTEECYFEDMNELVNRRFKVV